MPSIQTIGGPELQRRFGLLVTFRDRSATRAAFREGSGIVRDAVRSEAPEQRRIIGPRKANQGSLKQAIVSFGSKRRGAKTEPAAYERVNIITGRIIAPHGHLVEFGTRERRPKRGKFLTFAAEIGRGLGRNRQGLFARVFAKRVAGTRPNAFHARGLAKSSSEALTITLRGVQEVIERLAEGKSSD